MFVSLEAMLCVRVDSLAKWVSIYREFFNHVLHTAARLMMPKTTTKMKILMLLIKLDAVIIYSWCRSKTKFIEKTLPDFFRTNSEQMPKEVREN